MSFNVVAMTADYNVFFLNHPVPLEVSNTGSLGSASLAEARAGAKVFR